MKGNRFICAGIIVLTLSTLLNLYFVIDAERKFFATNQCVYELVGLTLSTKGQVERKLNEIRYAISNSEDKEKLQLAAENLELKWQNEKLMRDLFNMFNLLKGREIPLDKPSGRTKI